MWTIDEFNDAGWFDFKEFCEENDVYPDDVDLDSIVDSYYVSERVKELADNYSWDTITDYLRDITWDGDHDELFENGDYLRELTEDVLWGCKDEVLEQLHRGGTYLEGEEGYVGDEQDEDGEEGEDAEDNDRPVFIAGCVMRGLYGAIVADAALPERRDIAFEEEDFQRVLGGGE